MSLLGWLGKDPQKETVAVNPRSLSPLLTSPSQKQKKAPIAAESPVILGILGTQSKVHYDTMVLEVLAPVLEAWGTPDEILLPAEGDSSQTIHSWAIQQNIPARFVGCDWSAQGKTAKILRDSRIQRDATHLILLQGPRSNAYTTLAEKLHRKGRLVVLSERPGAPVRLPGKDLCADEK